MCRCFCYSGFRSDNVISRPPPKVVEFIEPGKHRAQKRAGPLVCDERILNLSFLFFFFINKLTTIHTEFIIQTIFVLLA